MQLQSFSGPTTDNVPVRASQRIKLSVSSLVQLASGSNEPVEGGGGRSKIPGSVCVSVVEVMVSAVRQAGQEIIAFGVSIIDNAPLKSQRPL